MNLERYYYRYGLADYLTPMRLYDLCRADEEGIFTIANIRISYIGIQLHTHTLVREYCKDNDENQWDMAQFDPRHP